MTTPGLPTDWSRYDVPALATILTEDHSLAWDQVIAWRTCYELLGSESARLISARAELADAWPPERSPASTMYLSYLDMVIESMTETGEAAIANSSSLSGVLLALADAKAVIDGLHSTWQMYAAREQTSAIPAQQPAYQNTPADWADDLNAQAHQHMANTDQTIFENARRLVAPDVLWTNDIYDEFVPIPSASSGLTNARFSEHSDRLSAAAAGSQSRIYQQARSEPLRSPGIATSGRDIESAVDDGAVTSATHGPGLHLNLAGPIPGLLGSAVGIGLSLRGAGVSLRNENASAASPRPGPRQASEIASPDIDQSQNGQVNSQVEPGHMTLAPSASAISPSGGRNGRRRRQKSGEGWTLRKGGPSILAPEDHPPISHDPGPGVIGIDL